MIHSDKIRSLLTPYMDTLVFPKFFLWILDDLKYGTYSRSREPRSFEVIKDLIDLCNKWINTQKKPSSTDWHMALGRAAYYAAASIPKANTDLDYLIQFSIWTSSGERDFHYCDMLEAQINKLETLIEDQDGLFSFEDYEKD